MERITAVQIASSLGKEGSAALSEFMRSGAKCSGNGCKTIIPFADFPSGEMLLRAFIKGRAVILCSEHSGTGAPNFELPEVGYSSRDATT